MNGEKEKHSVSLICVSAKHPQFQSEIAQGAEQQLQGTGLLKLSVGLYLVETDEAHAALHNLFNYGLTQNKSFGQQVVQVLVLECAAPIATLLTLPEDVRQWMQARDIRVRSVSSPAPTQPQPPAP